MDLSKITSTSDAVNVIIEISASAEPVKYEFNKELGLLQVDRFLSTAMVYPCNYGFVPNTCAGDGDPVDVLVLTQYPLASGVL
ncbi:inorganic pyrophosphatase, partial [Wolbachia endosymbiont of Atemnus politus]